MSDALKIFMDAWDQFGRLPIALLIAAAAIALGIALKKWQRFDNRFIPLFVILWCALWYALLGDARAVTSVLPGWRQHVILAFYGVVLGFVTWSAHKYCLKKLEKFLPDGFFPEGTFDTDTIAKSDVEKKDEYLGHD